MWEFIKAKALIDDATMHEVLVVIALPVVLLVFLWVSPPLSEKVVVVAAAVITLMLTRSNGLGLGHRWFYLGLKLLISHGLRAAEAVDGDHVAHGAAAVKKKLVLLMIARFSFLAVDANLAQVYNRAGDHDMRLLHFVLSVC